MSLFRSNRVHRNIKHKSNTFCLTLFPHAIVHCSGAKAGHSFTKSCGPTGTFRNGPQGGEGDVVFSLAKSHTAKTTDWSFYSVWLKSHFKPWGLVGTQTTGKWPSGSFLYSTHPPLYYCKVPIRETRLKIRIISANACTTPYARVVTQPNAFKRPTEVHQGSDKEAVRGRADMIRHDHLEKIIYSSILHIYTDQLQTVSFFFLIWSTKDE